MMVKLMVVALIVGTLLTGATTAWELLKSPNPFFLSLALINVSTSVFLYSMVLPMLGAGPKGKPWALKLGEAALLILLAASSAAFWIEYLSISHRPGALVAAVTWSVAGILYVLSLASAHLKTKAAKTN